MSTSSRMRRQRATAVSTPLRPRAKPRPEPTVGQRLRYMFDASMARGSSALLGYLGLAVVVMVAITALAALILGTGPTGNPITATYNALLHTIDSGTVAGDQGTGYIVLSMLVTFGGHRHLQRVHRRARHGLDDRLAGAAQGPLARARGEPHADPRLVGHGLHDPLASWRRQRERAPGPLVVILADRDKVEMEDAIRANGRGPHGHDA